MINNIQFTDQETISIAHGAWPKILKNIRKNSPRAPLDISPSNIATNRSLNNIRPYVGIKTGGCIHHLRGGCTMCSFNIRTPRQIPDRGGLRSCVDKAIEYCIKKNAGNKTRYFFGLGTGGSFFDPTEIPPSVRRYLYRRIKEAVPRGLRGIFMFESRLEFVNEETITEAREYLGDNFLLTLGYGLESTNEVIREACINKRLPANWLEKIELLKRHQILCKAHIMVKPPFLNEEEAVDDVVRSVREIFEKQYAWSVVVMTMAIRKNTATEILMKNGEYSLPSIWSIIKIIKTLGPEICRQTTFNGFAWTNEQEAIITSDPNKAGFVRGCAVCSPVLMPHLLSLKEPNSLRQWHLLIKAADELKCACKKKYHERRGSGILYDNFNGRIISGINKLSQTTTGRDIPGLINENIKL